METASNVTTEQTLLTDDKQGDTDDEDKNNVDLGVAGLPQVNFAGSKNEFETINLDADGDDEEEEDLDRHLPDDKRKKKYRKKKKRSQPLDDSSDSSTDDERKSCRKTKETEINPVNRSSLIENFIQIPSINASLQIDARILELIMKCWALFPQIFSVFYSHTYVVFSVVIGAYDCAG